MENKELILSLIKSDIINNKLLTGLEAMGLDAISNYMLDLDDRIFELIGFDITERNRRDEVFEKYIAIVDKAAELEISKLREKETLGAIIENIYNELLKYKLELYTTDQG